jgi:DNA-binding transcriptional regulator YdaS (Cro superfamily)
METVHPIDAAAKIVGSQAQLAALLGITRGAVNAWKHAAGGVPIERCVDIERATAGKVGRRELRPLDWSRIWPELVADLPHPDGRPCIDVAAPTAAQEAGLAE